MISSTGMPGRFVAMDIAQTMNDLEPRAMAKLQQQAGGGDRHSDAEFGKSVPPAPARYDIAPNPPDRFIDVIGDISKMSGFFSLAYG